MDSGSKDKMNVDALGKVLKTWWVKTGFKVEEINYNDVGNCYVARFNQDKQGEKVLLMGHFDTVFPKGEVASRPFKIEGSRAYGPGVGDMKSGLVTMLYTYSRDLIIDESKNAGIAINLEPARANGAVVTGRKGVALLDVFIKGKAAHAGVETQKGANANLELAYLIIELQSLNNFDKGLTINVNVVSGGNARNVISDKARAEVDIRFVKRADVDHLNNYILKLLSKTKVPGTKYGSDLRTMFLPMERKENILSAYNLVCKAAREIGINIDEAFTGGGSDAGFTSQIGISTICGMGPIAGNLHSVNEYMEIPSMTERCKLLAITIAKFWGDGFK
jgi:glutamate carboxypeptidase